MLQQAPSSSSTNNSDSKKATATAGPNKQQLAKIAVCEEEIKMTLGGRPPSPLRIDTKNLEERTKDDNDFSNLQFRPYDDTKVIKQTGQGPFSPKLIPIQKNTSFSSSERSSDLEGFLAKNQEASQGQGHQMQNARQQPPKNYLPVKHQNSQQHNPVIHTNVNFSGVMSEVGSFLHSSTRSNFHAQHLTHASSRQDASDALGRDSLAQVMLAGSAEEANASKQTTAFIEAVGKKEIEEEKLDNRDQDSLHPFYSFNLTMEEEHRKIRNHTISIKQATDGLQLTPEELIPCDFLRYVANVKDDLDQLAFQLEANHVDNFPDEEITRQQERMQTKESFGQKIFKLFFRPTPASIEQIVEAKKRRKSFPQKNRPDGLEMTPEQRGNRRNLTQSKSASQLSQSVDPLKSSSNQQSSQHFMLAQSLPDSSTLKAKQMIQERRLTLSMHEKLEKEYFQEEEKQRTAMKPIYRLNIARAYTQDEWVTILLQSIQKIKAQDRIQANLGLQIEHLSTNRIRQSFYEGLEVVQCDTLRGEIWKLICKVHQSKMQYKRGVFRKFIEQEDVMVTKKITKDLGRTFPGNEEFKIKPETGDNRLYNVLKAYSAYDPETGYCQGMNFISAMLIQMMPDQEDAFWCLVYVMFVRDWRSIFSNDSERINQMISDTEAYLRRNHRQVSAHLQGQTIATIGSSFSSQIITLFIYDNDFSSATKIFELFLLDGEQVLVDLIAGMILHKRHEILELNDLELMNYLRKDMVQECLQEMSLMEILKNPITKKPIKVQLTYSSVEQTLY